MPRPLSASKLLAAVRGSLAAAERGRLPAPAARKAEAGERPGGLVGSSPVMQALRRTVQTVAASKAAIFITGESGTGKEVCAEAIHRASDRAGRPFVAINCAAIPRDLVESELFGHVKGAFTGAIGNRIGAAAQAHGGTLFLDEICEMDIQLQTKLLRFLQTGTVRRIGASEVEKVDVRIVCATNRDPLAEIAAGRFREDLYYRLHVIPVHLPPLREREGDVLEIARALLAEYAREEGRGFQALSPCAEAAISAYSWPGNVRELQNVLRSAVVLHDGVVLAAADLPEPIRSCAAPPPAPQAPTEPAAEPEPAGPSPASSGKAAASSGTILRTVEPLWKIEKAAIEAALRLHNDSIPRAAEALGISASTIYRKRQAWSEIADMP
jgi:two-component system repressor protein LuxO